MTDDQDILDKDGKVGNVLFSTIEFVEMHPKVVTVLL